MVTTGHTRPTTASMVTLVSMSAAAPGAIMGAIGMTEAANRSMVVAMALRMSTLLAVAPGLPMADLAVAMVALAAATVALAVATEAVAVTGVGEPNPRFSHSRGCWLGPCRANWFSYLANTPGIGSGAKTCWRDNALGHHPATVLRNAG
jgi:hypothetical protein